MTLFGILQQIRTNLDPLFVTIGPAYINRFTGDPVAVVPCSVITHRETQREPLTMGEIIRYRCISSIDVEIHAIGASLQSSLDDIANLIIPAIESGNRTLDGDAFDVYCSGWTDTFNSEGDQPRGSRTLIFTVEWQTTSAP